MPILCGHVQVYTLGRLSIDGFSFERVTQFNLEWIFSKLDSGFQSLVGFRILSAGFRIPKPRIPDSTSKKFLDSGIRNPFHGANFLISDRQQRVRLSGQYSSMKTIMKGVFRRSTLGLILFNIFMNDLSSAIDECTLFTYADDTQLFKSAENIDQVEHAINADLNQRLLGASLWMN